MADALTIRQQMTVRFAGWRMIRRPHIDGLRQIGLHRRPELTRAKLGKLSRDQ